MLWKYEPLRKRLIYVLMLMFVLIVSQWAIISPIVGQEQELLRSVEADSETKADQEEPKTEQSDGASEVSGNRAIPESLRSYDVVATGYYAGVESTGKHPGHPQYGITYSGVKVHRGIVSTIAADLSIFPLGTVLYIPGYGYGVVADIGGAIKGRVIDLYFPSREEVFSQWGKRSVQVTVIEEGDGRLNEERLHELERLFAESGAPPSAL